MSRRLVGATALTALVLSASAAAAAPGLSAPARVAAPVDLAAGATGDLHAFVQFDGPVTDRDVKALALLGIRQMHRFDLTPAVAVIAPRVLLEKAALLPGVVRVQQDSGIRPLLDQSKTAIRAVGPAGTPSAAALGLTGKGVDVAVLDTGFDVTHPDLDGGKVKGTFNFEGAYLYDQYQDGLLSDQVAEGTAPYGGVDENGHGTHVASTIAGTGEGSLSGRDFSGVAPEAGIYGFKVWGPAQSGFDFGWEANSMAAIEYIAEHPELSIDVVSNSWSIYEVDDPDTEPIVQLIRAAAEKKGLLFVFAAGNDGDVKEGTVAWPGAIGPVITVASTEKTGTAGKFAMSSFSSRGKQVDIAAPGSDIVAARAAGAASDLGLSAPDLGPDAARYMAISGTSMATPHVAGVAALVKQANPKLTARQVEELLNRTARDQGRAGHDRDYGWGFVDAEKAGRVALCSVGKDLDACLAEAGALEKGKWRDDWADLGTEDGTAQGTVVPLV